MPFEDSTFNTALLTEVLEHCPNPEVTLTETAKVLAPGGMLILTLPFLWPTHDCPFDEYRYTPWSMERRLKNSGFSDIKLFPTGGWDAAVAQAIGLWIVRRPMSWRKRWILRKILNPAVRSLLKRDTVPEQFNNRSFLFPGMAGTAMVKK